MAIDQIPHRDREDLVNVRTRRFWPVQIPISHWQLRHFISTPEPNHLYYAAGPEVFCLDTTTKQHRLIATLPFDARCTASGFGWVCVGGEKEGFYFAAIKLDGSGPRTLDVDAALPIDTWRGARRSPSVRVERIGEQIVNSISVHRLHDEELHLDDIVAVLTNNDKTVRVFSLPQNTEVRPIELPHPVNHATISPDGKCMIVVGDQRQAFLFEREIKTPRPQIPKPHNRLTSADIEWKFRGYHDLYVSKPDSPPGYFTTAWSPDGRLVAVGSEDGYITVFDAEKVMDPRNETSEAIVTVIASSRPAQPNPYPGAVRAMMFSPAPWDLLIWAEDQGRVCVSDLREGLRTKQVLVLDPKDTTLVQVTDSEVIRERASTPDSFERLFSETQRDLDTMEAEFLQRHRDRGLESTYGYAPSYIEARRLERQRAIARQRTAYTDDPQGLTAHEQQILDTLRESRQRQEAQLATGINYMTPDALASYSARARLTAADSSDAPELVRMPSNAPRPAGEDTLALPRLERTESPGHANLVINDPGRAHTAALALSHFRRTLSSRGIESRTLTALDNGDEAPALQRSSRVRGQRYSTFLPTPPSSLPAESSTRYRPAPPHPRNERGANEDEDGYDDEDTSDEDNDVWRNLDDAISNTRGPFFEYASAMARLGPPASQSTAQAAVSRAETAREDRDFRQHYLIRQRERLREAREEATATLNRTNDDAAPPTPVHIQLITDYRRGLTRNRGREFGQDCVRTAGLAMSDDGSTLWAACEDGIFEYQMNRKARLFWPAVDPR